MKETEVECQTENRTSGSNNGDEYAVWCRRNRYTERLTVNFLCN